MVMHARKPQRISDGYFEKHQAHPYQKYHSKSDRRTGGEYVSSDSQYTPLRSPNGNISGHGHSTHTSHSSHGHHHYHHVSDDRGYPTSRNTYLQKASDKERDRDYKSSRNKYTDSVRSPKDKRIKESEKERSNHERSESEKKNRTSGMNSVSRSSKYDKTSSAAMCSPGGEWTEHISSSGKKYYYNSISEVSQWDKPREFDSRRMSSKDSTYSSRSNRDNRSSSRSGRREEKPSKRTNNTTDRYWNNSREDEAHDRTRPKHSAHDGKDGQSLQDMDISPNRSTPLSENSYGARDSNSLVRNNSDNNAVPPVVVLDNSNQTTGSLLAAALPRIVAAPVMMPVNNGGMGGPGMGGPGMGGPGMGGPGMCGPGMGGPGMGGPGMGGPGMGGPGMCGPGMVGPGMGGPGMGGPGMGGPGMGGPGMGGPGMGGPGMGGPGMGGPGMGVPGMMGPGCVGDDDESPIRDAGPPTPTHSENIDPHAPPLHLDAALPRKMECLGSYSQVVGGTAPHVVPMMTPSLVNYVRPELGGHVAGWPADILDKQANKFTEEAYQLGCLQCTRVSSELKCARSLVRHAEIQATLQEQKIMYLRQQISRLEELKSQNSFMSDE